MEMRAGCSPWSVPMARSGACDVIDGSTAAEVLMRPAREISVCINRVLKMRHATMISIIEMAGDDISVEGCQCAPARHR